MKSSTGSPATAARNIKTIYTYVQSALDVTTSENQSIQTKSRRRRNKSQSVPVAIELKPASTIVKAPSKRRKVRLKRCRLPSQVVAQRCTFRVRDLVTAEELEDEDEADEIQDEVRKDFARFERLQSAAIIREESAGNELAIGDVIVVFDEERNAVSAFDSHHGNLFGGKMVTCTWESERDEEKRTVVRCGMLNDSRYGSRTLTTRLTIPNHGDVKNVEIGNDVHVMETKGVVAPIIQPTESLELQDLVGALLKRLVTFQDRAHTQNPRHDKRSRRLVLGMHEVRRGLLRSKIVLLVIATDLDQCAAVEEKCAELKLIATEQEVPILAPMNRRKLGKTLQKSVRVSCVGVYAVDGAEDLFQQILQRILQN